MKIDPEKTVVGVVGAGTMGAGIALTALYRNFNVIIQDEFHASLDKAKIYIEKFLTKKQLDDNLSKVRFTNSLEELSGADIVIEAVLEDLELKKSIFQKLNSIVNNASILTTNTSTLSVTAIASVVDSPERVGGLHFFNPAPVLPLVEVVKAEQTSQDTIDTLMDFAEMLGKSPVLTSDTPGFIVNRVARPFYGEALRILGENVADFKTIDKVIKRNGNFKMGPFELMDLIGIDINTKSMISMYEQSYGEPRYRPHPIQIRKMNSGYLGRKSGRGFYEYGEDQNLREDVIKKSAAPKNEGFVMVNSGVFGNKISHLLEESGYSVGTVSPPDIATKLCLITLGIKEGLKNILQMIDATIDPSIPILVQTIDITLQEMAGWIQNSHRLVGFDSLFFVEGEIVCLISAKLTSTDTKHICESFISSLGKSPIWIKDNPGLILPRVVCMLTNEAGFAVQDGVGDFETIDTAMKLGLNYPLGPLEWGRKLTFKVVLEVLEHLQREYGEDRYRPSYQIKYWAREEEVL